MGDPMKSARPVFQVRQPSYPRVSAFVLATAASVSLLACKRAPEQQQPPRDRASATEPRPHLDDVRPAGLSAQPFEIVEMTMLATLGSTGPSLARKLGDGGSQTLSVDPPAGTDGRKTVVTESAFSTNLTDQDGMPLPRDKALPKYCDVEVRECVDESEPKTEDRSATLATEIELGEEGDIKNVTVRALRGSLATATSACVKDYLRGLRFHPVGKPDGAIKVTFDIERAKGHKKADAGTKF
jgi:hypothetical protein